MWRVGVLVLLACGRIHFEPYDDDLDPDIPDLFVAYRCDELRGSTAPATVSAYNGTCAQCPTLVPGIRGNAYAFAGGAEEFIQLPAISTNLLTDRPFTLTLWSNAMPLTNASILVSKTFDPVDDKNVASLLISFAGGLLFETTSTGLDYSPLAFNTPSIEDGVWHHLAVRWNGTTKSAFVDGVLLGTTDAVIADSEQPVRIGADLDRLATVLTHKGLLDDIRFYRRALTDDEVLTISSVP